VTDWQPYAEALAVRLTDAGVLTPEWRAAFTTVPRHQFVPQFFNLDGERTSGDHPAQREAWLEAVYSDNSLITQLMPAPGTELLWPTSSSTRPSLMAEMLALLDVSQGQRVLEIGTGTGYNAALLSYRLSAAQVTSIDIDPELVGVAGQRLTSLGYQPHLSSGDGAKGVASRAPFERIIATCGVPAIPPAWVAQLAPGGLIVADVRGELASNLIVARKTGDRAVTGRFLSTPGHFMWMRVQRDNPLRSGGGFGQDYDFTDEQTATTAMPLDAFDDPGFRFTLQLAVPRLGPIGNTIRDGAAGVFLTGDGDGSWVEIQPEQQGSSIVLYGGPRSLWPVVAEAWDLWNQWGRPGRERFGLMTYEDGFQSIWLDDTGNTVLERTA
jgi:protein-L-isoaspartate O-methyltransferase